MSASVKNERKKDSFARTIIAPTMKEAAIRLDEWCASKYDLIVISVEVMEDENVKMLVMGWEHDFSRSEYSV